MLISIEFILVNEGRWVGGAKQKKRYQYSKNLSTFKFESSLFMTLKSFSLFLSLPPPPSLSLCLSLSGYRYPNQSQCSPLSAKLKFVTRPYTALNYALLAVGAAIILVIVGVLCFLILSRNRERIYSLFTAGEDA